MSNKRIVIVTGGSTGLGHALLEQFNALSDGPQLLVNIARRKARLNTDARHDLINITADLRSEDGVAQAQNALHGVLNEHEASEVILIHNAGQVTPMGLSTQIMNFKAIDEAFRLNVAAVMALTATFLNALPESTRQRIVLISSGAGRSPISGWAVYGATKAALDYYAQVLQQENPHLQCVALAPGVIDTDMQTVIRGHQADEFPPIERFIQLHAQQQLQSPTDTANKIRDFVLSADFGQHLLDDLRNYG